MPPKAENFTSVVTLKQALLRLDQHPNCEDLWHRVRIFSRFYVTYSPNRPGIGDADAICDILLLSASGAIPQTELAAQYEIRIGEIYNAWRIMHTILTLALLPAELAELGLQPADLRPYAGHVIELHSIYSGISTNLAQYPEILPLIKRNPHFIYLLEQLEAGYGVRGFLHNFVGENASDYFDPKRNHHLEGDFRRGLTTGTITADSDGDTEKANYNYVFLREALFARFLETKLGMSDDSEVSPEYILTCFQRLLEIVSETSSNGTYLDAVRDFINNLPYYESKMTGDNEYRQFIGNLAPTEYLELYKKYNILPYPLLWILNRLVIHNTQVTIANKMRSFGIGYTVSSLRTEISCMERLLENIILNHRLGRAGDEHFMEVVSQTHKQDIAILTAAAAGKLEEFEI